MDLADILTYLLPLAIFIISIVAGSKDKRKKTQKIIVDADDDFDQVNFFTQRTNEFANNQPNEEIFTPKNDSKPKVEKKAEPQSAPIFEEGEKAIFVEENEKIETAEKTEFDLRSAVIASAILEQKF